MRRSSDFSLTFSSGVRAGRRHVVLHLARSHQGSEPLVGFVVSKAVGNSVTRNRVARRLRAQMAGRLGELMSGEYLVVRALPPAAEADSHLLGKDLDGALAKARAKLLARPVESGR